MYIMNKFDAKTRLVTQVVEQTPDALLAWASGQSDAAGRFCCAVNVSGFECSSRANCVWRRSDLKVIGPRTAMHIPIWQRTYW